MAEIAAAAPGAGAINPAIAAKLPQGIGSLNDVVDLQKVVCLNGTHRDPASVFRQGNTSVLSSDADEQLLITVEFTESVKLHGISIVAPGGDSAPATVKLFNNPGGEMDFSNAESDKPTQQLELELEDCTSDSFNNLQFVKFQNTYKLVIFIEDNAGADSTELTNIELFGKKRAGFNMGELKKVG